jgi:hypothetical protein
MRNVLAIVLCILACSLFANGQGSRSNLPAQRGSLLRITPSPIFPIAPRQPAPWSIESKRYFDPLRAVNPNGPAHGNLKYTTKQDFKFAIRPNTPLRDGRGNLLGTIAPGRVQINKGAAKVMIGPDGKRHVYELVLGAKLNPVTNAPANSKVYGSGLVRRSAIPVQDRPALHLAKPKSVKGPTTAYAITGGDPKDPDLWYLNDKHKPVPYKFGTGKPPRGYTVAHRQGTDYVARPLDKNDPKKKAYVNVLSRLPGKGGTATSVFMVDKDHPITFQRLKNVPSKTVKLYEAGKSKPGKPMTFLKGFVVDPKTKQKTIGWVAEKAVKPKSTPKAQKKRNH